MKHIVIFGAGKSSTFLIEYLVKQLASNDWSLTVLDSNLQLALDKLANAPHTKAFAVNVENDLDRKQWIASADIVISLLSPALHHLIAVECLQAGAHFLTASYTDEKTNLLKSAIKKKGLLFLCEMGLDPGIDHMSAMNLIHQLKQKGAAITSFKSHCGGLVAPESDDNPWHYKISWNPRNVVLAGRAGAVYREENAVIVQNYQSLFDASETVFFPGLGELAWYPNRDSLDYVSTYDLNTVRTFIRTTLRYPEFCYGWKNLVELKLTDDTELYDTTSLTLKQFFYAHLNRHGFSKWLRKSSNLFFKQLLFLGMNDDITVINKGKCTAAVILQFALEKKLILRPRDKDMIAMLHELEYDLNGEKHTINSSLMVIGKDSIRTAMAMTVGLPLGIAAKLILQGKIRLTGLHIPILPQIYEPVLNELAGLGIRFTETTGSTAQLAGKIREHIEFTETTGSTAKAGSKACVMH